MSSTYPIKLRDGREWSVGSFIGGNCRASIIIPANGIEGLTDAEIGANVRSLIDAAWYSVALEIADDVLDRGGRLVNIESFREYLPNMLPFASRSAIVQQAIDIVTGKIPHPHRVERKKLERKIQKGYIYLLRSEQGHYKIGKSKDVPNRTKALGTALPFKTELIHTIKAADMVAVETQLHERYAHCRLNGEWFALTVEEVAEVMALTAL